MRKHRQGVTKGVTSQGVTEEGVTQYPSIMYALADPIKRRKLEKICQSLSDHNVLDKVYYGYPGLGGIRFDGVRDLLYATD